MWCSGVVTSWNGDKEAKDDAGCGITFMRTPGPEAAHLLSYQHLTQRLKMTRSTPSEGQALAG